MSRVAKTLAALSAVALLGAGASTAHADSVTRSIVDNGPDGRICFDGFGNSTTDTSFVRTKSGSVKVTCHFDQDETNWPDGTKINVFTFGDCATTDFNGNLIILNSRFVVNKNGSASMTCN